MRQGYIFWSFPPSLEILKKQIKTGKNGEKEKRGIKGRKEEKGKRGGKREEKKGIVVNKRENILV